MGWFLDAEHSRLGGEGGVPLVAVCRGSGGGSWLGGLSQAFPVCTPALP